MIKDSINNVSNVGEEKYVTMAEWKNTRLTTHLQWPLWAEAIFPKPKSSLVLLYLEISNTYAFLLILHYWPSYLSEKKESVRIKLPCAPFETSTSLLPLHFLILLCCVLLKMVEWSVLLPRARVLGKTWAVSNVASYPLKDIISRIVLSLLIS